MAEHQHTCDARIAQLGTCGRTAGAANADRCEGCGQTGKLRKGLCKPCMAEHVKIRRHNAQRKRNGRDDLPPRVIFATASPIEQHVCIVCGAEFKPKERDRTKCCGRECGLRWSGFKTAVKRNGGRVFYRVRMRKKPVKIAPKSYYEPVLTCECRNCGKEFSRKDQGTTRYMCSNACLSQSNAKSKRAGRKARRAMERGARTAEKIDPIAVFERAGWRCGICGAKTHKGKRGTCHPRAPELDHIVALANGGSHTWRNVQCACRECNGRKGATDYGQIPMFGFG